MPSGPSRDASHRTPGWGRASLEVANGNRAGFRFLLGSQTFCRGSSDIELSPAITADGQLQAQVLSLNVEIVDLGPRPGLYRQPRVPAGSEKQ